jgi:hypothetical protein
VLVDVEVLVEVDVELVVDVEVLVELVELVGGSVVELLDVVLDVLLDVGLDVVVISTKSETEPAVPLSHAVVLTAAATITVSR